MVSVDDPIQRLTWHAAQLRHAYAQLAAGTVVRQREFADGLISPAIEAIETTLTTLQSRVIELEGLLRPTDGNVDRVADALFDMIYDDIDASMIARLVLTTLSNTANSGGIAGQ